MPGPCHSGHLFFHHCFSYQKKAPCRLACVWLLLQGWFLIHLHSSHRRQAQLGAMDLSKLGRKTYVSETGLASVLKEISDSGLPVPEHASRRTVKRARVLALTDLAGLYGPLIKSLSIPAIDKDEVIDFHYLDPVAVLARAAEHCQPFQNWLRLCLEQRPPSDSNPWRLILYSDEVSPGNQLRHFNARKIQCVYWSFAEFERQALGNECLWFTLLAARSTTVARIGGMTVLWRHVIDTFFSPHSLRDGLVLPCLGTAIFADVGIMVSDEAALKASLENKGASGTLFCMHCQNVVARGLDEHDSSRCLVASTELDTSKFVHHTNESVTAILQHLKSQKPLLSRAAFERLEQSLGFNLVKNGLLNHPTLGHRMLETAFQLNLS